MAWVVFAVVGVIALSVVFNFVRVRGMRSIGLATQLDGIPIRTSFANGIGHDHPRQSSFTGYGALGLSDKELRLVQRGHAWVVPVADIVGAETSTSFVTAKRRRLMRRPMLVVTWRESNERYRIAFMVEDPQGWIAALGNARRGR